MGSVSGSEVGGLRANLAPAGGGGGGGGQIMHTSASINHMLGMVYLLGNPPDMEEHRLWREHTDCMKLECRAAGRIALLRLTAIRTRLARGAAGAIRHVDDGVARINANVPEAILTRFRLRAGAIPINHAWFPAR